MLFLKKLKERFFSSKKNDAPSGEIKLKSIFSRFRELLDHNNRALEIITDIGEKLSGDYIFDKTYIHTSYNELSDRVYKVIYNLNMLSSNKYIKLYEKFEEIHIQLKALIEGKTYPLLECLTVPLSKLDESLADVVGSKAARLGEIKNRLGYRTPDGFAITVTGYKHFLEYNELDVKIEELLFKWRGRDDLTEEISEEITSLILEASLPPGLRNEIEKEIKRVSTHKNVYFAVRSSAIGEDGEYTFAGQFDTALNVKREEIVDAYKRVVASLFSPSALSYSHHKGFSPLEMPMAVLCLEMVDASVSGVVYTIDPTDPLGNHLLIDANWGLGKTVVEGSAPLDHFRILRNPPYEIEEKRINPKKTMLLARAGGGTIETEAPDRSCLTEEQIKELVELSLNIERYFKKAQDIEWSYDQGGRLYILQTRPLIAPTQTERPQVGLPVLREKYEVLLEKKGVIAQRGIASGVVYVVENEEDMKRFPHGGVLVTRRTSPRFGRLMHKVSAIVTDLGSPTGHMASLAREFRIPTIVDTQMGTKVLHTGMEVTVDAEENVVYRGKVKELLDSYYVRELPFEDTREYRLLKQILSRVAPLNLTDPNDPSFSIEGCRTFHDILRFSHEKAIGELIEQHMDKALWKNVPAKKLKTSIPLDLVILDLGGGLAPESGEKSDISPEEITSLPMQCLWRALSAPGVWRTEPISVDFKALMSSMTSNFQSLSATPKYMGLNLAVVSREYLNLSLRLGYHFTMVDTYMGENMVDNYIYFRFLGGVTEITRRSRRAHLISKILEKYDFRVETKGDLMVGRIREISRRDVEERLEVIGRLIGFTRQLDVMLKTDKAVDMYMDLFFSGRWIQDASSS